MIVVIAGEGIASISAAGLLYSTTSTIPTQALQVKNWGADAVIVGSAIVKRLADHSSSEGLKSLEEFCRSLKQAIQ
jgi:hypothetical protein